MSWIAYDLSLRV